MPSVVALSDADLIKVVQDGTLAGMPSFTQFGDANIRAVVDFLCTLQGETPTNAGAKVATGLQCGQEDQRAQAAHRGRYARQPLAVVVLLDGTHDLCRFPPPAPAWSM
jgi:hypothetical protein